MRRALPEPGCLRIQRHDHRDPPRPPPKPPLRRPPRPKPPRLPPKRLPPTQSSMSSASASSSSTTRSTLPRTASWTRSKKRCPVRSRLTSRTPPTTSRPAARSSPVLPRANVDLILANATPALQAASTATQTISILGTAVTEYGVALDIKDFSGTVGGNISGTSDLAPLDQQADMLLELCRKAKNVGILYCSAEAELRLSGGRCEGRAGGQGA